MNLKIEYLPIEEIKPYAGNAKLHPAEQIEQIKNSIKEFGFDDPIAIWNGEIVEGHGRYIAAQELDIDTVPIIRLDHLTDAQRRAYNIAHNKLTMNSGFNFDLLQLELESLELDMTDFGFTEAEILELTVDDSDVSGGVKTTEHFPPIVEKHNDENLMREETDRYVQGGYEDAPVTREELNEYEKNADTLVTRRVIIVYRTEEDEAYIKQMLGINEEKPIGVVYDIQKVISGEYL